MRSQEALVLWGADAEHRRPVTAGTRKLDVLAGQCQKFPRTKQGFETDPPEDTPSNEERQEPRERQREGDPHHEARLQDEPREEQLKRKGHPLAMGRADPSHLQICPLDAMAGVNNNMMSMHGGGGEPSLTRRGAGVPPTAKPLRGNKRIYTMTQSNTVTLRKFLIDHTCESLTQ